MYFFVPNTTDTVCDANGGPSHVLMLLFITLSLFVHLQHHLGMASAQRGIEQWSKVADLDSSSLQDMLNTGEWPLLAAATGSLDQQLLQQISDTYISLPAEIFPDCTRTLEFSHTTFKILSRVGAYSWKVLVVRHFHYCC